MDVAILGNGPAGAICALQLARQGHSVLLIARKSQRHPLSETLTSGTLGLLASLNLAAAADAAAIPARGLTLVRWESDAIVQRESGGVVIERDRFDRLLVQIAAGAGARLVMATCAQAPRRDPDGGWTVRAGDTAWHARALVDARGRRPARMAPIGPKTLALAATWRAAATHSATEAVEDGWLWGGPMPAGRVGVCAVLQADRLAGLGAVGRAASLRSMLGRARLFGHLAQVAPEHAPLAVDITRLLAADLAAADLVCVGERAFAQDPLSSQGIAAAIASSLQGAAAVHTMLTAPEDVPLACAFHAERSTAASHRAGAHAGRLYAAGAARFGSSFWNMRAAAPTLSAGAVPPWRPEAAIRASTALRVQPAPILDGMRIRCMPALCHPALDGPVAFFGGVALAPLVERLLPAVPEISLLARWGEIVDPDRATRILAWMRAGGLVVTADAPAHHR